jgi:hypothetical protein
VGTSLHKREGVHLSGTSRDEQRGLWKLSITLHGTFARETWREGSFNGDSERYVKAGSESRDLFKGGPLADHNGRPLSGDERKVTFCLLRQLVHWGLRMICKEGSGNGHLSPYGHVVETGEGLIHHAL